MNFIGPIFLSILIFASPAYSSESAVLIQFGQADLKLSGVVDGTPWSGGGIYASNYADVSTTDMSPGFWSVSYSRQIDDELGFSLNFGRIDGSGFSRDEFSGAISKMISKNLDLAVGLYFSDASLGSEPYLGDNRNRIKGLQNLSLFLSLQRRFQITNKLLGFGRLSVQTGESEFISNSHTINSNPKPVGTSFALGGMYPLQNGKFVSLTYEVKDIEYKPAENSGGDPEEDFSTLSVGYGFSF
jgi:hypothetical protein